MKQGDLVKFVGAARYYKGRVGVVCKLYSTQYGRPAASPNSAMVHFAGAEHQGRAAPDGYGNSSGFHPMALDELEVINENR